MNDRKKSAQAPEMGQKSYWRSLSTEGGEPSFREQTEFRQGAETLVVPPVNRRGFMGLMSASMALAGAGLGGCVRKPTQYIAPYTRRPEDVIPGVPRFFATSLQVGSTVLGVVVESQDGRPSKIEGNPRHPASLGATDAWAQAEVLNVYDPDRSQFPLQGGEARTLEQAQRALADHFAGLQGRGGQGLALLVTDRRSPAMISALEDVARAYPQAGIFLHDVAAETNHEAGLAMLGLQAQRVSYRPAGAKILAAFDSDFLGTEADHVRLARGFADGRRVEDLEGDLTEMNRLYAIEPAFTITGGTADHRLQLPASQVGGVLVAVAKWLFENGVSAPAGLGTLPTGTLDARALAWVPVLGADLRDNRGASLVLVGERQPAWVHALGFALNQALGNIGETVVTTRRREAIATRTIAELATAIGAGSVSTLLMLGGNPAYDAPADLGLAAAIGRVETTIHLSFQVNETSLLCNWHLPAAHPLESWGDLRASDGTAGIQQPLIAPLFPSWSELDVLAAILPASVIVGADEADGEAVTGYALLRRSWRNRIPMGFERAWRTWLHDGVVDEPQQPLDMTPANYAGVVGAISLAPAPASGTFELVFALDTKVLDGRYANNGWLQELPDPMTKLTWDNAALISPRTARALGVVFAVAEDNADIPVEEYGQLRAPMLRISVDGRSLDIAAMVTPGVADNTIILPLGYGRTAGGRVATGAGFDTYTLRSSASPWIAAGATLTRVSGTYLLATTQDHGSVEGRPIVVEDTHAGYEADPRFVDRYELMPPEKLKSLWTEPNARDGQQWGMSIDLTTCTGCSACTVACQAENNISVVGKSEVLNGREMAWIRLDRYYSGDHDNPAAIMQPLACQHCENAPCEQVCPVAATVHGPEGTNDMAYNRCIGTRYCANNCPFKVRRFNFFNYSQIADEQNPLLRLQKNPDVTVRFRGVMEKCSYCIQRVTESKIAAKLRGDGVIQDGAVTPACGQACPTQAIVFGDINDSNSRVSQQKRRNRNYEILSWLNLHARTSYLAKIRNPNPALV